jgi:hypothetical protein
MKLFNPKSKREQRAVQAWQILVGVAMNRQTLTYKLLSQLMFQKSAPGVLDKTLGHIAFYCIDNDLPALTSIVVGQDRGTPGDEIPIDELNYDQEREKVYEFDWYNVYPPTAKKLLNAYENHH